MTQFTLKLTTWVSLATHKHGILPFSSAHWLSTQLDFKTISGYWVKRQSINETAGKSLVHNDVMTCCLQIGFFQSIRPAKWPITFECVTNKPVDCSETKHDWKRHVLCGLFFIFYGALCSDNRIVFSRSKSFLKSDNTVGLARWLSIHVRHLCFHECLI